MVSNFCWRGWALSTSLPPHRLLYPQPRFGDPSFASFAITKIFAQVDVQLLVANGFLLYFIQETCIKSLPSVLDYVSALPPMSGSVNPLLTRWASRATFPPAMWGWCCHTHQSSGALRRECPCGLFRRAH